MLKVLEHFYRPMKSMFINIIFTYEIPNSTRNPKKIPFWNIYSNNYFLIKY